MRINKNNNNNSTTTANNNGRTKKGKRRKKSYDDGGGVLELTKIDINRELSVKKTLSVCLSMRYTHAYTRTTRSKFGEWLNEVREKKS